MGIHLEISKSQWNFIPKTKKLFNLEGIEEMPMFYLYLFMVWSIFWLICIIWFFFLRHQTAMQMRSPQLVILSAIGAELTLLCTTLDIFFTHEHYPCLLDIWYILVFFPLYFIPFVLRFMRYFLIQYMMQQYNKKLISDPRSSVWVRESTWVVVLGFFITLMMVAGLIIQFIPPINSWCTTFGCAITPITSSVLVVMLLISLIIFSIGLFLMRKIEDPYHIKSELVTCFITWIVTLFPYIFLYWFQPEERNNTTALMFIFIVSGFITSVVRPIFLSYMRPPEPQVPEKILDTLEQIILDPEGYKLVEQIANEKSAPENPPFIKEVLEFKKLNDQKAIEDRARYIYNNFILPGSPHQVNISAHFVRDITAKMENITSDIFNIAYREVMKLLKTNFLREIKNLPAYAELVKQREAEIQEKKIRDDILIGTPK